MNTKQKITSLLAAGFLLASTCHAAVTPGYLTDGNTDYSLSAVLQREDIIGMPHEKGEFSYSFAENDVQYSDFLIAPQPFSTGLKLTAQGAMAHTLTVQLIDKESGETVKALEMDAYAEKPNEYIIPEVSLMRFRRGYYIQLQKPSVEAAEGTFAAEVLCQDAETMLRSMGVISGYENGQFIPFRNITRAEMCAMLARAAGYTEVPPRQFFDDVPASHWASSYIAFCYENGIIKGTGDNLFSPDAEITGAEMITMLVRMLGHTPKAETMGGHPYGYMIVASQESITRGNPIIGGASVRRKTAMECLHNSLFVPLMVQDPQAEAETYTMMDGTDGQPLDTLYLRLAQADES